MPHGTKRASARGEELRSPAGSSGRPTPGWLRLRREVSSQVPACQGPTSAAPLARSPETPPLSVHPLAPKRKTSLSRTLARQNAHQAPNAPGTQASWDDEAPWHDEAPAKTAAPTPAATFPNTLQPQDLSARPLSQADPPPGNRKKNFKKNNNRPNSRGRYPSNG